MLWCERGIEREKLDVVGALKRGFDRGGGLTRRAKIV